MLRILLVDDHELFRSGMKSILEANENMLVIGEADSGESALKFIDKVRPDVVLMDVNMPGMGGIEATRKISQRYPEVRIIVVTVQNADPYPNQLLEAGALAYISKGCPAEEMFQAIDKAMKNQRYLSNQVAQKLSLGGYSADKDVSAIKSLSAREMQVMLMITSGDNNQTIADTLNVSPKTVSTYRHRIFEKLHVVNDVELTHYAIDHNLLG